MNQFRNILYVTETTAEQTPALARAVSLAEKNQAALTIIDVVPAVSADYSQTDIIALHMQALEALIAPYQNRLKIDLEVVPGTVFLEAIRAVLRNGHDLLIKAAENPDFLKKLFGSNDMHLLRKCPCPVWLMKPSETARYNCVLAAVDFDPLKSTPEDQSLNQEILGLAGALAVSDFASLHVGHAWQVFAEGTMLSRGDLRPDGLFSYIENEQMRHQEKLYQLREALCDRIGADACNTLSPQFHLLKGSARKVIPELALTLQAGVVVMGTVAHTGIAGLIIGNTAESILEQLTCSVLAIKPPGFITPVKPAE